MLTRCTKRSQSTIDHLYANCKNVIFAGVVECHLSDHLPIIITIKKQKEEHERVTFTCRMTKNVNEEILAETKLIVENFMKVKVLINAGKSYIIQ